MTAIETHDLTKYYGDLCAVDHLSLSVDNEIFALLGPNGSGKTTTVLMLTTLLRPTEGTATVCGYDCATEGDMVRKKLSYVPQDMAVDIRLTGRENVVFFAKLYGVADPRGQADEALAIMELADRADDLVKTYSGGMRRRLELAQALVHEPAVLFLDEPTLGLDVAARKKIWEHIRELRSRGMTVFVTTHYMDEADKFCDRVAIISRGSIRAIGEPKALKARLMKDVITATISGEFSPFELSSIRFLGQKGDEVSFTAENGREALPLIAEALTARGMKVHSLSLHEPTLDDVFLNVVGSCDEPRSFNDQQFRGHAQETEMKGIWHYMERDLVKWARGRVAVITLLVMPAAWLIFVGLALPVRFTGNYLDFITPGILVMTMLASSLQGGSLLMFDKILGFLNKFLALPSPRENILFGKILFITIRGVIQATVILLIAILIGATILSPVQYGMIYVILILFGILFSGLATTLALYIDDHDSYAAVNTLISMPLFFMSSALMPYSVMPSWMRSIAMINPLSFAIDAIRSVGMGEVPLMQIGLLFVTGGLVLIVCVRVFRKMTV